MKIYTRLMIMIATLFVLSLIGTVAMFLELGKLSDKVSASHIKGLETLLFSLMVMIGCVCAYMVYMSITHIVRPLQGIQKRIHAMTDGDLTIEINYTKGDEISLLAQDVKKLASEFNDTLKGMMQTSNKVVHTLDLVRVKSLKTTSGAKEMSGQAQQIATAAEEMGQTITDIAKNASTAAETANNAMDTARKGKTVADGAVETVNRVHTSTEELASMIEKLTARTSEIGGIVTVIKGIADQTNLLALNAAIEAARAGEQGRGFAVVADEVRKLAERTISATAEISQRIASVQEEASLTARSMGEASSGVAQATSYIKEVGDSLNSIVETVQKVNDQITRIAAAIEEQSSASEEVVTNIGRTHGISQNMESMTLETMHEVNGLITAAEELRITTTGFKIKGIERLMFDIARTDHRLFVAKISAHLNGDMKLNPDKMPDHHTCRFGKWYDTDGIKVCGGNTSFRAVEHPHQRIHQLGKEAVALCDRGDGDKARAVYTEIESISDTIGTMLEQAKKECTLP